jgi:hypothetical protein
VPEQKKNDNDRQRDAQQPEQNIWHLKNPPQLVPDETDFWPWGMAFKPNAEK